MDDRLADYEELMRTVEKLRASLEASKMEKKDQKEEKKREQEEEIIRVKRALQEPLFEKNRLLNALRNRGARVFTSGGLWFADEAAEQWE